MVRKAILVIFLAIITFALAGCVGKDDSVLPRESDVILADEESTALPESEESPPDEGNFIPPDVEYIPSFTTIPWVLSDYVRAERYSAWLHEETERPKNLFTLIHDMQISRDELEKLYYSTNMYYLYDYSFDLLYGGDEAAVYGYLRRGVLQ